MHPILFKIGRFEARTYGLMLALAFIIGIYYTIIKTKKLGIDPNLIVDLSIVLVVSSLVGSRLLYVMFHFDEFRHNLLDIINPFQSSGDIGIAGLTMIGGLILAVAFGMLYLKWKKLPVLKISDITSAPIALGIFITRIGCFMNGCCFGTPCDLPWGVKFPYESPAGYMFQDTAIHPAQLYSALGGLIIFFILLFAERYNKFDGFLIFTFFVLYSIDRFIIDYFRYYEKSMVLFSLNSFKLSVNQGICIAGFIIGILLIIILSRKRQLKEQ